MQTTVNCDCYYKTLTVNINQKLQRADKYTENIKGSKNMRLELNWG